MSERKEPRPRSLDDIVGEARSELVPPAVDWDAVERGLHARIAAEETAPRVARSRAPGVAGRVIALGLAAAAAAALVVGRDRDGAILDAPAPFASEQASGGSLRASEGAGEIRVSGVLASTGHGVRAGDVIETTGARAVFERPRKVTWMLEGASDGARGRARVTAAGEPLVLSLEEGAVEAQVTKSDLPESFAVDVAAGGHTVRVAVHGTHLRVTRAGDRVVVDLSEGVVSIGVPPRVGATYGTLVTAPAHVELDVADPAGTLRVDHAAGAVRPPVALDARDVTAVVAREPIASAAARTTTPPPPPSPQPAAHDAPAHPAGGARAAAGSLPVATTLANAVRECAATVRKSRPSEVRVTVSSTLRLTASSAGEVQSAVFDPPLLPEIQTCAAGKIYGTKLETPGPFAVPIEFSY